MKLASPKGDWTMFKTIALALVLAGVSLSFIVNASAAPARSKAPGFGNESYMLERHDPTNTNGN
jgi:hypothetical protein